ncbi:MAG: PEGA domain-containing protein [Myxococcales bacterium]|nr:PEGA domain-containing protein [Myxococcales bacterium]
MKTTAERYSIAGETRRENGVERTPVRDRRATEEKRRLVMVRPDPARVVRQTLEAFIADHRLLSRLRHPQILLPRDYGADGRGFFFVEEEPAGARLAEVVSRTRLPAQARARAAGAVALQVCAALEAAHACRDEHGRGEGVAHGSLTPEFVWLGADGRVWVSGFSLSRFLSSQAAGRTDDVQALAKIFFYTLGDERAALEGEPTLAPVVALMRRCLSARLSERPTHAGEVAEALRHAVAVDRARAWRAELAKLASAAPAAEVRPPAEASTIGADQPAASAAAPSPEKTARVPPRAVPASTSDDMINPEAFWNAPAQDGAEEQVPALSGPASAMPPGPPVPPTPARQPALPNRAPVSRPRRTRVAEQPPPGSPGALEVPPGTTPGRIVLFGVGGLALAIAFFYLTGRLFCGPPEGAEPVAGQEAMMPIVASDGGTDGMASNVVEAVSPAHVSLEVVSEPEKAAVSIDGTKRGVTPVLLEGLTPGLSVNVRIELPGYRIFEQRVVLAAGPRQTLSAKLVPLDSCASGRGWIRVSSKPSGALVLLDGAEKGKTPAILSGVCADQPHQVVVRHDGYRDEVAEVTVVPGQVQNLEVTLRR